MDEDNSFSYLPDTPSYATEIPKPFGIMDQVNNWSAELMKTRGGLMDRREQLMKDLESVESELRLAEKVLNGLSLTRENRV